MPTILVALTIALTMTTGSFAEECLHGANETPAQQTRREQALTVALRINFAEATIVGPRRDSARYRPLEELRNVPPAPKGFDLQFFTDGRSYSFSLKDRLDACHYAIFSDEDRHVYEGTPRARGGIVPLTNED